MLPSLWLYFQPQLPAIVVSSLMSYMQFSLYCIFHEEAEIRSNDILNFKLSGYLYLYTDYLWKVFQLEPVVDESFHKNVG